MMEKGARFRDWRFSSTSTDMGVVKSFLKGKDYNVLFCIKCTSGVRIHELSAFPAESEVVLMPGVQYVVRYYYSASANDCHIKLASLLDVITRPLNLPFSCKPVGLLCRPATCKRWRRTSASCSSKK